MAVVTAADSECSTSRVVYACRPAAAAVTVTRSKARIRLESESDVGRHPVCNSGCMTLRSTRAVAIDDPIRLTFRDDHNHDECMRLSTYTGHFYILYRSALYTTGRRLSRRLHVPEAELRFSGTTSNDSAAPIWAAHGHSWQKRCFTFGASFKLSRWALTFPLALRRCIDAGHETVVRIAAYSPTTPRSGSNFHRDYLPSRLSLQAHPRNKWMFR